MLFCFGVKLQVIFNTSNNNANSLSALQTALGLGKKLIQDMSAMAVNR